MRHYNHHAGRKWWFKAQQHEKLWTHGSCYSALDFGPEVLDFTHVYKQAHKWEPNAKWAQEFKLAQKKIHYPLWSIFFKRQLIFSFQVVPSFAWSIFLRRYLKLLPHRLFFPQKLLWEDFSSEVLIFQTFLPVFNSICDKNPSCRIICEKQTSMHKNAYRISDSQGKTK